MSNKGIITACGLTVGYHHSGRPDKVVQRALSFALRAGELTCLLGPNGAGKSTLLRTLSGVQPPLAGELALEGRPLRDYSAYERSQLIGVVLTDRTYAGGLTVRELVALGRHPYVGFFGRLRDADHAIVERALGEVGIVDKAGNYIAELSDGERQKVMIAKALAQECPVILLDEPTAFLDVTSRIEVMHLLHRLARQGKCILISTHDIEQSLQLADSLLLLSKEHGMLAGAPEDLVLRGEMDRFFGRGAIGFDHGSGTFRMMQGELRPVLLEAPAELDSWVRNLLFRNGFRVAESHEDASEIAWKLQVFSPEKLILHRESSPAKTCGSFEALVRELKTL